MCGICGQFNYLLPDSVSAGQIRIMADTLQHRGPDGEGYYVRGAIGLGHKRLAIIDPAGGEQPMSDNAQQIWVTFNGEIYNYRELRTELQSFGHTFKTFSDTEVIVYGYKQWGKDVLNHLNGMFGLAVWDAPRSRLLLARDRLGIKPVYYRIHNGTLFFASELRALLAVSAGRQEVDLTALNLFLRYRYTPSPLTLFQGIRKLAPGSCLTCVQRQTEIEVEQWWQFKPAPFHPLPQPEQARSELTEIYQAAVRRHLLSDVPLGLLLSGGVDSALLLALMSQNGRDWPAFTVGYGNSFKDDELAAAAANARCFGMPHHTLVLSRQEFEATLSRVVACLEEPVATSSIVPMYHICRLASEQVKVALIGQGPDELFGGYERHLGLYYGKYWRALPGWLRRPIKNVLGQACTGETIRRGLFSLDTPARLDRYQQVFSLMPAEAIDALFYEDSLPPRAGDSIFTCWQPYLPLMSGTDELGGFQFLELRSSLPDELLLYADKLSMAHSLELRVPYLDKELVEYVERLPAAYKIHGLTQKWLHKQISRRYLPAPVVQRKKQRFAANVVDDWLRESGLSPLHHSFRDPSALIYRYLKPAGVQKLYQEHINGKRNHYKVLFSLVVLEEWLRHYLP